MTDWKEGVLRDYHIVERGRQMVEEEMAKNPSLSKLRLQIEDAQQQLAEQEEVYRADISNCDWEMQKIKIETGIYPSNECRLLAEMRKNRCYLKSGC